MWTVKKKDEDLLTTYAKDVMIEGSEIIHLLLNVKAVVEKHFMNLILMERKEKNVEVVRNWGFERYWNSYPIVLTPKLSATTPST